MSAQHRNKYSCKNSICLRCGKVQEAKWKPCIKCGGLVTEQEYKKESEARKMKSEWFRLNN